MLISFYLDQHGCAKNQIDGELIFSQLVEKGLKPVDSPEKADLIIVNSCGFIESAKQESLEAVIEAKAAYPQAKVLLAGCLSQRYAEVLKDELPEADGIIGNGNLDIVGSIVDSMEQGRRPVETPPQEGISCGNRDTFLSFPGTAYVKISEGCDNRCSFCAIPLIRGRMRSRSKDDIVAEVQSLIRQGIFEINLVGQDLAAFGMDGVNPHQESVWNKFNSPTPVSPLAKLLEALSALEGNFWLRLLYIHPDHFPLDILPLIAQDRRLLPYFDIPFQSGSTPIIKAMNRIGSQESYLRLVHRIRQQLQSEELGSPALRTTFLVGFPGEKEEDFAQTVKFLQEAKPDWSGCFTYSPEEDTPAVNFPDQVETQSAEKRKAILEKTQEQITAQNLAHRTGKTYQVLIEEIIQGGDGEGNGLAIGRAWFQAPEVDGAVVVTYDLEEQSAFLTPGKVVTVYISGTSGVDLTGELV